MKSTAFRLIAVITLLLPIISGLHAQDNKLNVVTTAVPFLRISPDARAAGMGDIGMATSPDANAVFWNWAKVPFNENKGGVSASYTPWLKDILNDVYMASLAGFYHLDEEQSIAGSLRYFSLGNITFTDNLGNDWQTFRPKEFGVDIGYTRKLSENSGVGLALRYINSNLAGNQNIGGNSYKPGNAVAGDISYYFQNLTDAGQGWAFGAALTNLGSKIAYTNNADQKDYIPANLGVGTAYTRVFNQTNKLTFGLDINKLLVPTPPWDPNSNVTQAELDAYRNKSVVGSWFSSFGDAPGGFSEELKEFQVSAGAEYMYNNQFALRAGYFYEDKTKGNRKYFTVGVGIKYNMFGLDFSYLAPSGNGVNRNPLSNTLRFSLHFNFNEGTGSSSGE